MYQLPEFSLPSGAPSLRILGAWADLLQLVVFGTEPVYPLNSAGFYSAGFGVALLILGAPVYLKWPIKQFALLNVIDKTLLRFCGHAIQGLC